jgi:hypothetical protein
MTINKMFYTLLFIIFFSCGKKDQDMPLTVNPSELVYSYNHSMKTVTLSAGINAGDITVSESGKDWCSAEINGTVLSVTVTENETLSQRKAVVTIRSGSETATVSVTQNPVNLQLTTKEIPLGGNSYVTSGTSGQVTDEGFYAWNNAETVFSTWLRVNQKGNLKLYLKYNADTDGNVINVSCQGHTFDVTLPKQQTAAFLGHIENVDPGYIRVDFKGVAPLKGAAFATPASLLVSGTATQSMNFVGDFDYYWGRRGPSVHMNYPIPGGTTAEWFYNEVTVPVGFDPVGSYFMANGFGQGYFGMQVNSASERRILFSVWSPANTDDPNQIAPEDQVLLIKKGTGVSTGSFGNEGSGGQSYLIYNWTAGTAYKFLNRVRPIDGNYSEYTAYFFAPETGTWKLIAQWKRPKIQTYYTGAYSFVENFNKDMGYLTRKAYYRNQWVYTSSGQWVELVDGRFSVDATGRPGWRKDFKGGTDGNGFFLQNCGFFDDFVNPDTPFQRTAGSQPVVDFDSLPNE